MKREKRKRGVTIVVLLYLLLIVLIDYPMVKRVWNEREQKQVIEHYNAVIAEAEREEAAYFSRELEKAKAYNDELAGKEFELPATFTESNVTDREYENILNPAGDGVMGYLEIPKIEVYLPIYHGTTEAVLQKGVGHLEGTGFPIGGESTHVCLTAHRGLPDKKLFTNLDLLEKGDVFYIYVFEEVLAYEVESIETVTPDYVEPLMIREGEDRVTLVTCTPYGINSHRLYVHGTRIPAESDDPDPEETIEVVSRTGGDWKSFLALYWWIILTICLLVWLFIMLLVLRSREKAREEKEAQEKKDEG